MASVSDGDPSNGPILTNDPRHPYYNPNNIYCAVCGQPYGTFGPQLATGEWVHTTCDRDAAEKDRPYLRIPDRSTYRGTWDSYAFDGDGRLITAPPRMVSDEPVFSRPGSVCSICGGIDALRQWDAERFICGPHIEANPPDVHGPPPGLIDERVPEHRRRAVRKTAAALKRGDITPLVIEYRPGPPTLDAAGSSDRADAAPVMDGASPDALYRSSRFFKACVDFCVARIRAGAQHRREDYESASGIPVRSLTEKLRAIGTNWREVKAYSESIARR